MTTMTAQQERKKNPKIIEKTENGKTVRYYNNAAVAELIGRAVSNLNLIYRRYTEKTGEQVKRLEDGVAKYIRGDELLKVLEIELPFKAEMLREELLGNPAQEKKKK